MPLPDDPSMPWPPKSCDHVADHYERWAAWYSGEPDDLALVYGGDTAASAGAGSRNRTARAFFDHGARRGLAGMLQRWFWGAPTVPGEQRTKLHLPVAADITALSADLLYAEPPALTVPDGNAQTADQLEDYIEDGLFTSLREGAEVGAAMGGMYLRVVWDDQVWERPWLTATAPDMVVPEWRWDQLAAATFWRVLDAGDGGRKVVRHLERHERGVILHGVYEGTADELGRRVPLTEYTETVDLAGSLDDGDVVVTGSPRLTAGYVPNMRPNRIWRGVPSAANLGRSDFSGVEGLFDSIDEVWSSWQRDIRLGKARLYVPQDALLSLGRGKGAMFDADQELHVPLDMGPNPDANKLTNVQFDIRMEEHRATLLFAVETAVRDAGYSMQSLSGTGDVAMTATEFTGRERRSALTRGRKTQYHGAVLRDMVEALLAVDAEKFGPDGVQPGDVQVEWPRNVFVDPLENASTVQLLRDAVVMSQATAIETLHPDWDETRVRAEMIRLQVESSGGGYVSITDAVAVEDDDPTGVLDDDGPDDPTPPMPGGPGMDDTTDGSEGQP